MPSPTKNELEQDQSFVSSLEKLCSRLDAESMEIVALISCRTGSCETCSERETFRRVRRIELFSYP